MKDLIKNLVHKKRSPIYIPWYAVDEDIADEGENDSWFNYIRRNMSHTSSEQSAFPDSSWSYARDDSFFEDLEVSHLSDDEIHDEVMKALYVNENLDASNIKIIVLNGLVSLFGSVETIVDKNEAEKLIKAINGVWGVRNELKLAQEKPKGFINVH